MPPFALRDSLIAAICRLLRLLFQRGRQAQAVHLAPNARIALLKPCCLGDVIMATATLTAVRRTYPQAHLTFITGAWSLQAVRTSPLLDASVEWDWSPQGRVADLQRLVGLLRVGHYDAVLVLDRSPLLGLAAWLARIPVRAGMDAGGRGFSLTHPAPATPGRHEALLYLDVAAKLKVDITNQQLHVDVLSADTDWAAARMPEAAWVAVHAGGGVNPGSTLTGKRWPVERFRAIAARLRAAGYGVVVVGGPEDAGVEATGVDGSAGLVLDLRGQTTIGQLAAVLARCRLFVGNDTGPMHLAVAVGTPVVAVFGPSRPAWYGPFSDEARVIYHGEACRGCRFRGGLVQACVHDYQCMQLAEVDEVWAACGQLLERLGLRAVEHGDVAAD